MRRGRTVLYSIGVVNQHDLVRVAIVEDEALFRSMLSTIVHASPQLSLVGVAATAAEALQLFPRGSVDVAVLDVGLGTSSGIALGVELRRRDPHLRTLLLSAHNAMDAITGLPADVRHGWSYLSKTASIDVGTLLNAIRATARGAVVLDPELVNASVPRRDTPLATLTSRQLDVLRHVARGMSNATIAAQLGIVERSVHNHLTSIYATLGLDNADGVNPRVAAVLTFLAESQRPGSLVSAP